jgi:hypothetical protein
VLGVQRTLGERRPCDEGAKSDEEKKRFHDFTPNLRWSVRVSVLIDRHGLDDDNRDTAARTFIPEGPFWFRRAKLRTQYMVAASQWTHYFAAFRDRAATHRLY